MKEGIRVLMLLTEENKERDNSRRAVRRDGDDDYSMVRQKVIGMPM